MYGKVWFYFNKTRILETTQGPKEPPDDKYKEGVDKTSIFVGNTDSRVLNVANMLMARPPSPNP